ncbi:hypothetical protein [Streptomyces sp. bgisy100]|uniref:hypothetical protein n=1 Tax=Streptomyces sp. bgisy100 TaxID=3413783 RepID=UPI003D757B7C
MTENSGSESGSFTSKEVASELRLLPWSGSEGKPCFLSTGGDGGPLARLADSAEEGMISASGALVDYSEALLGRPSTSEEEILALASQLTDALRGMTRVAVSRGRRLPAPGGPAEPHEGDDGPHLPAESFG